MSTTKRVKTITCHNVYNIGASLQAYALTKYLKNIGCEAEIINYIPDYLRHYRLLGCNSPAYNKPLLRQLYQLAKLPQRIMARLSKRKKRFDSFTKKYLPVTSKVYRTNNELKADVPYADVYFAGSDQIWNTLFPNGKDPSFYLDFAPEGSIRASYAASFSTDKIYDGYEAQVSNWLKRLDYVSVRESSGVALAKKLGVDFPVQVLDPVFLLNKEQWRGLVSDLNTDYENEYILVYDFEQSSHLESFVKTLAKENKLKIFSVLPCTYCDSSFENSGPLEFLDLIENAAFVVSNSFHATAFSIIFEKQFFVFNREEAINSRMHDILQLFSLDDRIITDSNAASENEINYQSTKKILDECILKSKDYIKHIVFDSK